MPADGISRSRTPFFGGADMFLCFTKAGTVVLNAWNPDTVNTESSSTVHPWLPPITSLESLGVDTARLAELTSAVLGFARMPFESVVQYNVTQSIVLDMGVTHDAEVICVCGRFLFQGREQVAGPLAADLPKDDLSLSSSAGSGVQQTTTVVTAASQFSNSLPPRQFLLLAARRILEVVACVNSEAIRDVVERDSREKASEAFDTKAIMTTKESQLDPTLPATLPNFQDTEVILSRQLFRGEFVPSERAGVLQYSLLHVIDSIAAALEHGKLHESVRACWFVDLRSESPIIASALDRVHRLLLSTYPRLTDAIRQLSSTTTPTLEQYINIAAQLDEECVVDAQSELRGYDQAAFAKSGAGFTSLAALSVALCEGFAQESKLLGRTSTFRAVDATDAACNMLSFTVAALPQSMNSPPHRQDNEESHSVFAVFLAQHAEYMAPTEKTSPFLSCCQPFINVTSDPGRLVSGTVRDGIRKMLAGLGVNVSATDSESGGAAKLYAAVGAEAGSAGGDPEEMLSVSPQPAVRKNPLVV